MHHLRTDYLSPSFVIDLYIEFFLGEVALILFACSVSEACGPLYVVSV